MGDPNSCHDPALFPSATATSRCSTRSLSCLRASFITVTAGWHPHLSPQLVPPLVSPVRSQLSLRSAGTELVGLLLSPENSGPLLTPSQLSPREARPQLVRPQLSPREAPPLTLRATSSRIFLIMTPLVSCSWVLIPRFRHSCCSSDRLSLVKLLGNFASPWRASKTLLMRLLISTLVHAAFGYSPKLRSQRLASSLVQ